MMDINCTHHCKHQQNGKCTLSTPITLENTNHLQLHFTSDCPYYEPTSLFHEKEG